MASGGPPSTRSAMSEPPRVRTMRYRMSNPDAEDARSVGSSTRMEDRPNNWDFFDWQPMSLDNNPGSLGVRRETKKGNQQREQEKEQERGQSLLQGSPPQDPDKFRHRTPSTFPRVAAATKGQREAIEHLRQKMTFSDDADEVSSDGGKNNERYMPPRKKERPPNFMLQDTSLDASERNVVGASSKNSTPQGRLVEGGSVKGTRTNNLNAERDGPDSNQIVGRLMQIRDYIKQTTSMMHKMEGSTDPKSKESYTRLASLIDSLKEQERGYLNLLQKVLASREDELLIRPNSVGSNSKQGTDSEATSELDVQSDTTADTEGEEQEEIRYSDLGPISRNQRPQIEDHLGRHSDTEQEDPGLSSSRSTTTPTKGALDSTLIAEQCEDDNASPLPNDLNGLTDLTGQRRKLETDLASKNDELQALRDQHDLLQQMLQQQEQLRTLQNRQNALMALQQEAETKLAEERGASNSEPPQASSRHMPYQNGIDGYSMEDTTASDTANSTPAPNSDDMDEDDGNVRPMNGNALPEELYELRQKLDYLKNVYSIKTRGEPATSEDTLRSNMDSEFSALSAMSMEREQLQDKLQDLQQKKQQMDNLLQELQSIRDNKVRSLVGDVDQSSMTSSQAHFTEGLMSTMSAGQTADQAQDVLDMMEARRKLKKLQDVKERLNQLKDLVQYYQMSSEFIHGKSEGADSAAGATTRATVDDEEDASSMPLYSDYEDPQLMQNLRDMHNAGLAKLLDRHQTQQAEMAAAGLALRETTQAVDAVIAQSDASEPESQMSSSLGAWRDDPDIQEKVGRLKAAKEKLHRLQELVAMVQQTPEAIHSLPDDLAELAASLEEGDTMTLAALTQQASTAAREASARIPRKTAEKGAREGSSRDAGAGAAAAGIPSQGNSSDPREQFYQNKMIQQQAELKSLMEERHKLLSLQQELQRTLANEEQRAPTQSQVDSGREQEQDLGSTDKDQSDGGTEAKSVTDTVQVTFGEPLETVISNEELYGQMRQQRILREELREKKKELEKFMKKDRPKRHYFRNQDNQSDNVSYSNKSDQYGASASEDVTMATWGGSTAGNLESIEENGSRQGHTMGEVDDGYPSDGIQQVEEEEEARDDSDDRDTYTIEEEYSPKRHQRIDLPTADGGSGRSGRDTRSKGASFQGRRYESGYSYNHWAPDNNQVLNNVRSPSQRSGKSPMKTKRRRKTDRTLLEDEVANLREQVHLMRTMFQVTTGRDNQSLLQTQPEALGSPSYMSQVSPQAYQQQAMMNLQTNYAQLLRQQQEMSDRFGRLEQYIVSGRTTSGIDHAREDRLGYYPNHPMNRSPGASSQQRSAQDAQRLDSLLAASPRDQFELKPRGFGNPYTTTGSHASRGTYIDSTSNERAYLDSYHNNVSDNEPSRNIPREERSSLRSDRTNPFQLPQTLSSARYSMSRDVPSLASLERSLDHIPIDVIHAANEEAMQMTDTSRLQMGRGARPRNISRGQETDTRSKGYRSADRLTNQDEEVIARRFPTPSRASAAARLADQQMPPDPMGNSTSALQTDLGRRGFSDLASVSSVLSSVPGGDLLPAHRDIPRSVDRASGRNDGKSTSDVSGFEDLRETIYAEVATLISQNERRPHYLIELFRELQMLDSDYLRQRALYAIQDLISTHLTEEVKTGTRKPPAEWSESPVVPAAEELTPSESMISTEDDEAKHIVTIGSRDAERFDYVENVETTSSLSTPNSTSSHIENPFAQDSLGDTVIHLDKALRKMREYEIKLAECDSIDLEGATAGNTIPQLVVRNNAVAREILPPEEGEGTTASGPLDQASDGSISDVPYPRIDTQQLDHQIKNIMREIIPVLKEHMDDICSQQLIQYIKRLVLLLTKQKNDEHEFVRFFHSQLGASLQDSLAKFEGRKLRECGEDLLVDLSEILFNELAFFKLMQDLDNPNAKVKASIRQQRHDSQTSTETATTQEGRQDRTEKFSYEESTGTDSSDEASEEDRETEDEPNLRTDEDSEFVEEEKDEPVANNDEQEALGKDRDDEFAAEINTTQVAIQSRSSAMKIELAPSETKPYTRIGSDEDDEGDSDEAASCEDPSETAVSRDAEKERSSSLSSTGDDKTDETQSDDKGLLIPEVEPGSEAPKEQPEGQADELLVPKQEPCAATPQDPSQDAPQSPVANSDMNGLTGSEGDRNQAEKDSSEPGTSEATKAEALEDETADVSPPQVNGEPADVDSQEITIDDLPAELHTITKEELDKKMAEEQIKNDLCEAALESLSPKGDSELAGDPNAVKEPVTTPADPEGRQL